MWMGECLTTARDLVSRYRQKLLLLFKLFLLERKVLFFKSPVVELSGLAFHLKIKIIFILFPYSMYFLKMTVC